QHIVVNRVDDAVVANPDPIFVVPPGELVVSVGSRVIPKGVGSQGHSLLNVPRKPADLARRPWLDIDAVFHAGRAIPNSSMSRSSGMVSPPWASSRSASSAALTSCS